MDRRASIKVAEHNRALEAAYRRGYHHGLTQTADLIFGLLSSGMPASAVAGLCRVFEEQVVIPWRSLEAKGNLCFASIIFQYCQITWPLSERDQQSLKLALRHDSLPKVQFATKTLPKDFSEQAERGRPYLPVESVLAPNLM